MNKQILTQWVSSIYDNKFKILSLIALISSGIGYYAYRNDLIQKRRKQQQKRKQQIIQVHYLNTQLPNQQKNGIQSPKNIQNNANKCIPTSIYSLYYFDKQLEHQLILSHLDLQGVSVQLIYKYSPLIAIQQYSSYTKQIIHRRRLIRPINQSQYISLIIQYQHQIQQLLQRSRHQILQQCGVDLEEFQKMEDMFQVTEDITGLMMKAKKVLKQMESQKKCKRNIPKNLIVKIINEQIGFIKAKIYDRLSKKLIQDEIDQDLIYKVIQTLINDIIYEKFGYQKEQIEYAFNNQWNIQLKKQLKELKQARQQLDNIIGNFNIKDYTDSDSICSRNSILSNQIDRTRSNNSSFNMDEEKYAKRGIMYKK